MYSSNLKKKYTMRQLFTAFVNGYMSLPKLIRNKKSRTVDGQWIERLMLATTEVNGCEVCSYAHTRMALKEGFTQEEIDAFLSGSKAFVKEEESTSILFAQHTADTMGKPDFETYQRVVDVYGRKKAEIIKAGITVMMMGNIAGIPLSAFMRRLQGNPYTNSTLLYELGLLVIQPFFMIIAIPVALLKSLTSRNN
jgi:AhpD family alkylhydroperoxidase